MGVTDTLSTGEFGHGDRCINFGIVYLGGMRDCLVNRLGGVVVLSFLNLAFHDGLDFFDAVCVKQDGRRRVPNGTAGGVAVNEWR